MLNIQSFVCGQMLTKQKIEREQEEKMRKEKLIQERIKKYSKMTPKEAELAMELDNITDSRKESNCYAKVTLGLLIIMPVIIYLLVK